MSDPVYTMTIQSLRAAPVKEGLSNVVVNIRWLLRAVDGDLVEEYSDTEDILFTDPVDFTPYPELTESEVIGWVEKSLGVEKLTKIKADMASNIAYRKSPPVVDLPLPWEKLTDAPESA
jgi:hypothetical protein